MDFSEGVEGQVGPSAAGPAAGPRSEEMWIATSMMFVSIATGISLGCFGTEGCNMI